MHGVSFLLEEATTGITLISIYIWSHIVQNKNDEAELVSELLQIFGMLEQKIWALNKINLTVRFDEVVAHWLNIVDYYKFDSLVLDPLGKVDEHLVVILQCLAVGKDDVFADLLLRNFVFILDQEVFFDFVKSFLIEGLSRHQVQTLSLQTTTLLRQERL